MATKNEYVPSVCEEDFLLYISQKKLLALEHAFGGQTIYFAAKPRKELIDAVGADAAGKLTDVYKTSWLYIPKVLLRYTRNEEINRQINSGSTLDELAARFRLKTPAIKAMLVKYYGYHSNTKKGK